MNEKVAQLKAGIGATAREAGTAPAPSPGLSDERALAILDGVIRNEGQIGLAHRCRPPLAKKMMASWFDALAYLRSRLTADITDERAVELIVACETIGATPGMSLSEARMRVRELFRSLILPAPPAEIITDEKARELLTNAGYIGPPEPGEEERREMLASVDQLIWSFETQGLEEIIVRGEFYPILKKIRALIQSPKVKVTVAWVEDLIATNMPRWVSRAETMLREAGVKVEDGR